MTEPSAPLRRPIQGPALLALLGVIAVGDGLARRHYGLVAFGLLLIVVGVALGYRAWRAGKTTPREP
jgi:hypothetical protein